jgi:peptidyl-prolyl cis-trans isomerase C
MQPETDNKQNDPIFSFHLMKFAVEDFQKNSDNLTNDEYSLVFQRAKEEMLLHQIILTSTEAACVVIPPPVLQQTLNAIIAESPSDEAFRNMLAANNLQLSDYAQALHNDLRVETILGKISSSVESITSAEMRRFYSNHKMNFKREEQRHASIITIFSQSEKGIDSSYTTISKINERLLRHPENFDEEARTFSECDTRKDGGQIGILNAGELCKELSTTLFSLDCGKISGIIEKDNAYHILKCNAIYPAINVTFKEAKEQIFVHLLNEKKLSSCRLWLQDLIQGIERT